MGIANVISMDFIAEMSHGVFQVAKTVRPDCIRIPEHILLASNAVDSVIFHCIILPALRLNSKFIFSVTDLDFPVYNVHTVNSTHASIINT